MYTNSIHSLWALQLLGISPEYDIWHMVAWIFNISPSIHQVYLTYWWKFRHINIMRMVLRGIFVSLHSLLYDCTMISSNFYCIYSCTSCTHCVDIVALVLRLWNLYIWYINSTPLSTKRYIVYRKMKPDVSFSRLHIRPSHIYAFSNITSSYCPSRLRMLASREHAFVGAWSTIVL